jgi:chromosome segregation ATPase
VTGNRETGNVNLIISQGYDNYIDPYQDSITTEKAFKWLRGVDRVVYEYVHTQTLATHQKEQKEIEKTLSKLESQQKKLESKIKKVEDKQRKLEATRTIVDENDLNVDSKKIAKEQELALDLQNEYLELNSELKSLTIKIKDTREDLNKKKKAIAEFKHNKK